MPESTSMQSTVTGTSCEAGEPGTRARRAAGSTGCRAPRTTGPPGPRAARGAGPPGPQGPQDCGQHGEWGPRDRRAPRTMGPLGPRAARGAGLPGPRAAQGAGVAPAPHPDSLTSSPSLWRRGSPDWPPGWEGMERSASKFVSKLAVSPSVVCGQHTKKLRTVPQTKTHCQLHAERALLQPEVRPGGLEAGGWRGRELSMVGLKTRNGDSQGPYTGCVYFRIQHSILTHHTFLHLP